MDQAFTESFWLWEFLFQVGIFGAKVLILAIIVLATVGILVSLVGSARSEYKKLQVKKKLKVENIGEQLELNRLKIQSISLSPKEMKKQLKDLKKQKKQLEKQSKSCAYVLDFHGDIKASQIESLREEVSILIQSADSKKDEVILRLDNAGGAVNKHGFAASQLQRLRDHGFHLTVCVDEMAASGGYLMACVGHKILSAPFAFVGSIGVIAQLPNFHRFLQKQDVDFEEHYAGKNKRTLTLFGKSTEEKREKLCQQLDEIHGLFKSYVEKYRPKADFSKVTTGEVWLGIKAKELGLVDEISTSDDFILSLLNQNKKVYAISFKEEEQSGMGRWFKRKVSQMENHSIFLTLKKLLQKII